MNLIDPEVIDSPGVVSLPFWPSGQRRVLLSFTMLSDKVVAIGRDPDQGDAIVFTADLRSDQSSAFRAAVVQGVEGEPIPTASNQNVADNRAAMADLGEMDLDTVVITGTGSGDGSGPKLYTVILSADLTALEGQTALATGSRR